MDDVGLQMDDSAQECEEVAVNVSPDVLLLAELGRSDSATGSTLTQEEDEHEDEEEDEEDAEETEEEEEEPQRRGLGSWLLGVSAGLVIIVVVIAVVAKSSSTTSASPPEAPAAHGAGFGSARHALIIGIDGLGSLCWHQRGMNHPVMDGLIARGASSLIARSVIPSTSKPNWAGVLMGSGPEQSGVDANRWMLQPNLERLGDCTKYGVSDAACFACFLCQTMGQLVRANASSSWSPTRMPSGADRDSLVETLRRRCEDAMRQHGWPNAPIHLCLPSAIELVDSFISTYQASHTLPEPRALCNSMQVPNTNHHTMCREQLLSLAGSTLADSALPSIFGVVAQWERQHPNNVTSGANGTLLFTDHDVVVSFLEPRAVDSFVLDTDTVRMVARFDTHMRQLSTSGRLLPRLMFVHLDVVDHTGHDDGWCTPHYATAVSLADKLVGQLLETLRAVAIDRTTHIIVTSDHGGGSNATSHQYPPDPGWNHRFSDDHNLYVPFLVAGPGVRPQHNITGYVRNLDASANALHALGIPVPPLWIARPLRQVFFGGNDTQVKTGGATAAVLANSAETPSFRSAMAPAVTQRVVVIDVSGLSPSAAQRPGLMFGHLSSEGSASYSCRATMPCTSDTNLATLLMAAGPEEHGVCEGQLTWANCKYGPLQTPPTAPDVTPLCSNVTAWQGGCMGQRSSHDRRFDPFPTIFHVAKAPEAWWPRTSQLVHTSAFYRSRLVGLLTHDGLIDSALHAATDSAALAAAAAEFERWSSTHSGGGDVGHQVMFLELTQLREVGLRYGFSSAQYTAALNTVSGGLDGLMHKLAGVDGAMGDRGTLVIMAADMSGTRPTFGGTGPACMLTPLIINGPGFQLGYRMDSAPPSDAVSPPVRLLDVASVAVSAMGLNMPRAWQGRTAQSLGAFVG